MLLANKVRFITQAPRDLTSWTTCFDIAALPVLERTTEALEELAANEDAVDAHMLAEVVTQDPLMTLKLLTHVAALRRGRGGSDIETATEALVMLGIPPFFRAFGQQANVQDMLAGEPEALEGIAKVLRRAHRAANFALAFAVHRMDHDAPVIHEAALLHDFAELLLWLRAPSLALEIARRQLADSHLRSVDVQRSLLHTSLGELQHELMLKWRLPALLVRITDDHHHEDPQVRNVMLAIRLARHSAASWDNPALPDDLHDIGALLNLAPDPTLRLLHQIDAA